jgi:tetratricopeptide (TPR) repeat protein
MQKFILLSISCLFLSLNLVGNIFSRDSVSANTEFHDQLLDSIKKMEALRSNAPIESLELGKRVIELTHKTEEPSLIGLAEKTQGVSYYYQAVFDTALIHYRKAIPEFEKANQKIDIGKVYNNIAIIYRRTSKSELALENYLEAKKIYEEVGYIKGIASIYLNVGGVYYFLDNLIEAEQNFLMALSLFKDLDYGARLAKVNMNLGVLYMDQGLYEKAFKYLNQADVLSEEYDVSKRDKGDVLLNLAEIAYYKKEYKKSLKYHRLSEQIRIEINDYWGLPKNYLYAAKCLTDMGRYDEALKALGKSEEICLKYKLREDIQMCYTQKAIVFEKTKSFEKAYFYYQKQSVISDSLAKKNRSKRLESLQLTHYLDLKEKELAIKELDLSRKNILLIALISLILFATAFVLYYLRSRSNRNKLLTLSLEQKVRLSQMNPHFLFNSLSVIQDFILDKDHDKAFRYLSKLSGLVRGVLHNSTHEYITVREELDILAAYVDLQNLRFENGISYRFDIDSEIDLDEIRIPPMLAQPIIENSLIHGDLRNNPEAEIKICLLKNEENNSVEFTIEDNGVGLLKAKKQTGVHKPMATEIIRDRVRIYNYYSKNNLSIDVIDLKSLNEDLHGTRVRFSIPLCNN